MMKSLLLWCLQLLLLLAEHCNSYLGRMDPSDEERIDEVAEGGLTDPCVTWEEQY